MPGDDLAEGSTIASDAVDQTQATQASQTAMPVALGPGTEVGKFTLAERLGAGAMGVVYAARDPELDRRVAIKLIKSRGSGLHARLYREAQALARVAHPNVVVVHEVGEHAGQVFVAMELVRGETLRGWLAKPRALDDILRVLVQAGRGLAAAHAAGLVHRDFKPDNVLIGDDGRARVTDFGLARTQGEAAEPSSGSPVQSPLEEQLTQTGAMVGTPTYASPEQLAGQRVGPASDQFSFCITAWEAVYGKRPFQATSLAELMVEVASGRISPPPPDRRVPRRVQRALVRGLSPIVEARFPSMTALLAELSVQRRRLRGIAMAAAAAGAVGLTIGVLVATGDPPGPTCSDDSHLIDRAWSAERGDRLRAQLAAAQHPFADKVFASMATLFGGYAKAWSVERERACTAARAGDAQAARTIRCLDLRLAGFTEDVDAVIAHPQNAVVGFQLLEPIATCAVGGTPVVDARKAGQAAQIRWVAGDNEGGRKALDELIAQATKLPYPPIEAELLLLLADQLAIARDFTHAREHLTRAAAIAERAGDDRTKAIASVKLARLLASHDDVENAERELQRADAALARLGPEIVVEARAAVAKALVASAREHHAEAAQLLETAIAMLDSMEQPLDDAPELLVGEYKKLGRTADAERLAPRIPKPDPWSADPRVAAVSENIQLLSDCDTAFHAGDFDRALTECERAVAKLQGADQVALGLPLMAIGLVHEFRFEHAAAREYYDRQLALYERANNGEQLAEALQSAGRQSIELGEPETAIGQFRRAVEVLGKLGTASSENLVWARFGLGRALVAGDQIADGIAELEWALPRLAIQKSSPRNAIANARLSLADGLWKRNGATDRRDARRSALLARDDIRAYRATLTDANDKLTPYYIKRADRIAKRVEDWIASHR